MPRTMTTLVFTSELTDETIKVELDIEPTATILDYMETTDDGVILAGETAFNLVQSWYELDPNHRAWDSPENDSGVIFLSWIELDTVTLHMFEWIGGYDGEDIRDGFRLSDFPPASDTVVSDIITELVSDGVEL